MIDKPTYTQSLQLQSNIDNALDTSYNNTKGGEQNGLLKEAGEGVQPGSNRRENNRGRESRWAFGRGDIQSAGVVLLSESAQAELRNRGIVSVEYFDTSTDSASFVYALNAARNADTVNGWAVSPQTIEELQEKKAKCFMDREGNSGFAITKDGDIFGVFRHKLNGIPGATAVMIPLAIENGNGQGTVL